MPKIVQGIEEKVHELVEQYNLTEASRHAKSLAAAILVHAAPEG